MKPHSLKNVSCSQDCYSTSFTSSEDTKGLPICTFVWKLTWLEFATFCFGAGPYEDINLSIKSSCFDFV